MRGKRFKDWLTQAESDLEHAKKSLKMETQEAIRYSEEKTINCLLEKAGLKGDKDLLMKEIERLKMPISTSCYGCVQNMFLTIHHSRRYGYKSSGKTTQGIEIT